VDGLLSWVDGKVTSGIDGLIECVLNSGRKTRRVEAFCLEWFSVESYPSVRVSLRVSVPDLMHPYVLLLGLLGFL